MLNTTLLRRVGSRLRIYPVNAAGRVRTADGVGTIIYATEDMYLGVMHADGRVDEYPVTACRRAS
jgi:hypothetical protein